MNESGTILYKPAYCETAGILCAKVVSVFADNVHINAIASLGSSRTKISAETMLRANVYMAEAGEICLQRESGLIDESFRLIEIGDVFFKSVGNAIQNLVYTAEVLLLAEQYDLGQKVTL